MTRRSFVAMALGIASLLITILVQPPAAQAASNGQYIPWIGYPSGMCIESIGLNAQLKQDNCRGTADQLWSLSTNTRSFLGYTYYQIYLGQSTSPQRCMGVSQGSKSKG